MSNINSTDSRLELAQIGWVVPDIHAAAEFLASALGIAGFPQPQHIRAQDLGMTYHGEVVAGEWLTTQAFSGGTFIELVQPVSGRSMFHDYLARSPAGGTQHLAFRLPVSEYVRVTDDLRNRGYAVISEVDHPIARITFFDTYQTLGVAPEIMPSHRCRPVGRSKLRKPKCSRTKRRWADERRARRRWISPAITWRYRGEVQEGAYSCCIPGGA